jgi:hypothetical protein
MPPAFGACNSQLLFRWRAMTLSKLDAGGAQESRDGKKSNQSIRIVVVVSGEDIAGGNAPPMHFIFLEFQ